MNLKTPHLVKLKPAGDHFPEDQTGQVECSSNEELKGLNLLKDNLKLPNQYLKHQSAQVLDRKHKT